MKKYRIIRFKFDTEKDRVMWCVSSACLIVRVNGERLIETSIVFNSYDELKIQTATFKYKSYLIEHVLNFGKAGVHFVLSYILADDSKITIKYEQDDSNEVVIECEFYKE